MIKREVVKLKNPNHPSLKEYSNAIKKGLKSHHIVPREDKWIIKKAGSSKASAVFDKKEHAVEKGRQISSNQNTSLFIHSREGKIVRV